jgi:hypothetical protein
MIVSQSDVLHPARRSDECEPNTEQDDGAQFPAAHEGGSQAFILFGFVVRQRADTSAVGPRPLRGAGGA